MWGPLVQQLAGWCRWGGGGGPPLPPPLPRPPAGIFQVAGFLQRLTCLGVNNRLPTQQRLCDRVGIGRHGLQLEKDTRLLC